MTFVKLRSLAWLALLALPPAFLVPAHAAACGGFFCSQVPPTAPPTVTPQPIYQSGEKILFSLDADGAVTAVVQVSYTGPSQNFAWIVPVTSLPEVSLGTADLLTLVDGPTTPSYVTARPTTEGTCATPPACARPYSGGGGGCGFGAYGTATTSDAGASDAAILLSDLGPRDAGPGFDAGVTVLSRSEIGPYDIVVLSGVDALAVARWLTANGYNFPEEALAQLDPYGAAHDDFVAVRLRKDAMDGELVPIVLRYTGEPCIPIRLTAIATVPDMPITAFFLSDGDVRSDNYAETAVPEDLRLWQTGGTTLYDDILSTAVDDAGHHAFVTEFAGPTPAARLSVPDFSGLEGYDDPRTFVFELGYHGSLDALTIAALARVLPPPDGVAAADFFRCIGDGSCTTYDDYLRTVSFRAADAQATLDREVAAPRRDANYMLADHPRLTRLATTLSADEMTLDPTFVRMPTRRDVSNVHTAGVVTKCGAGYLAGQAPIVLRAPGGAETTLRAGTPYPGPATYCPPSATPRSAFCSCAVPHDEGRLPWLLALGGALVFATRRARRRR